MATTARRPAKDCVQCPYCDHPPVKTASTLRGHVAKAHGLTGRNTFLVHAYSTSRNLAFFLFP